MHFLQIVILGFKLVPKISNFKQFTNVLTNLDLSLFLTTSYFVLKSSPDYFYLLSLVLLYWAFHFSVPDLIFCYIVQINNITLKRKSSIFYSLVSRFFELHISFWVRDSWIRLSSWLENEKLYKKNWQFWKLCSKIVINHCTKLTMQCEIKDPILFNLFNISMIILIFPKIFLSFQSQKNRKTMRNHRIIKHKSAILLLATCNWNIINLNITRNLNKSLQIPTLVKLCLA